MTARLHQIVQAKWFHYGIVAVIVLAGVVARLETRSTVVPQYGAMLHTSDSLILGTFVVEALLKMAAHV